MAKEKIHASKVQRASILYNEFYIGVRHLWWVKYCHIVDEGNRKRTCQSIGVHGEQILFGERLDEIMIQDAAMSLPSPRGRRSKRRRLNEKVKSTPSASSDNAPALPVASTALSVLRGNDCGVDLASSEDDGVGSAVVPYCASDNTGDEVLHQMVKNIVDGSTCSEWPKDWAEAAMRQQTPANQVAELAHSFGNDLLHKAATEGTDFAFVRSQPVTRRSWR